jgi:predicted nucleic acid-binding protein
VRAFLRRHNRVALDTCVFVYHLEANPTYVQATERLFVWLEERGSQAVTSTVTMTELLVQPYRNQDIRRVDNCYALLSRYPNLIWMAPSLDIADIAAGIRAKHNLKALDAIQAATAVYTQMPGLITNDPVFRRLDVLDILLLDDVV